MHTVIVQILLHALFYVSSHFLFGLNLLTGCTDAFKNRTKSVVFVLRRIWLLMANADISF